MPKVAVVVGASADRRKFGNKAVRAFLAAGYRVIPVNPRAGTVEGLATVASVSDVPDPIDVVTIYVKPAAIFAMLPTLARKQIREVWLNPGADDDDVVTEARRLGLNVIVACSIVGVGQHPSQW